MALTDKASLRSSSKAVSVSARCHAVTMVSACRFKRSPALVNWISLRRRMNKDTPWVYSNKWIRALTADWVTNRISATLPK